jgi:hypothetical protein
MGWIGAFVAATALVVLAAAPAGAGEPGNAAPLHVRKVVVGPVPPGTQFVETVACDDDIIFTGGPPATSVQLVFDAQGNPVGGGDTVTFVNEGQCSVTETETGGAASVTYQCEGSLPVDSMITGTGRFSPRGPAAPPPVCESSGPQSDPIAVNIESERQEATVTVTNTFTEAPPTEPAVAVVEVPRFTG